LLGGLSIATGLGITYFIKNQKKAKKNSRDKDNEEDDEIPRIPTLERKQTVELDREGIFLYIKIFMKIIAQTYRLQLEASFAHRNE